MSNNLLTLINHLFTTVLLVIMLFACQNMPESDRIEGFKSDYQTN